MPLLIFAAAVVPYDPRSPGAVLALLAAILVLIVILSEFTEQRRHLLRRFLRQLFRVPASPAPRS